MDPNNVNDKFRDEFDSEIEERINREDSGVSKDDEEMDEWKEWAMSWEDDDGNVID